MQYSRKSIIRTSIIPTVDYMNTTISIVARANVKKKRNQASYIFTAIQIPMCMTI